MSLRLLIISTTRFPSTISSGGDRLLEEKGDLKHIIQIISLTNLKICELIRGQRRRETSRKANMSNKCQRGHRTMKRPGDRRSLPTHHCNYVPSLDMIDLPVHSSTQCPMAPFGSQPFRLHSRHYHINGPHPAQSNCSCAWEKARRETCLRNFLTELIFSKYAVEFCSSSRAPFVGRSRHVFTSRHARISKSPQDYATSRRVFRELFVDLVAQTLIRFVLIVKSTVESLVYIAAPRKMRLPVYFVNFTEQPNSGEPEPWPIFHLLSRNSITPRPSSDL